MKLLFCFLLFPLCSFSSVIPDIIVNKDTTISGTWNITSGTVMRFSNHAKVYGSGTINGGIIDANRFADCFDTTLTLNPQGSYNSSFSVCWFGAKPALSDNSKPIQRAIDICKGKWQLDLPIGTYSYYTTLKVEQIYLGLYVGTSIHLKGESSFWNVNNMGSVLDYKGASVALGLQLNKGTEIEHIVIQGGWVSPVLSDTAYYNLTFANYLDQSGHNYGENLRAICIDYNQNQDHNLGGSTGTYIHDVILKNFHTMVIGSKNGETLNNDILLMERVQFGDGKVGFISTQGQEKGNVIKGIYSWGSIHTLFSSGQELNGQGGGYHIDGGNIAGRCIQLFNISQSGWNIIHVNDLFVEAIGTLGTVYSGVPLSIENCTFDFAYPNVIGYKVLLTSNALNVVFRSCAFRYFGYFYPMLFYGLATFEDCFFSGAYSNSITGSRFTSNCLFRN